MYKIIDCEQGSDLWFQARLGRITASVFSKVITKTGKLSSSAEDLINRAVAELIVGEPDETFQSDSMLRGSELENDALSFFNFTYGYNFKPCGFMDSEKGFGCSPDALDLGKPIGLELKCPEAHTHLAYLSGEVLPTKHIQQVQGSMMISGFDKWVFGSYHPSLPCFHVVVERDDKLIATMRELVTQCCEEVKERYVKLSKLVA